uniref:Probable RNA-binding protein EIF1AD n=1 Tax=Megaselia scalaris TaxID=36166 RepID=T1GP01_MEGSC
MSRTTRRKHVFREMMEDDLELPKENQKICKVIASRGNNLHEVESSEGPETFLVSMPNKFRNNVWVKRNDFILVEPIEEGDKVKAEICRILTPDHVKEYTKQGVWPKKFTKKREHSEERNGSDEEFMHRNTNRRVMSQEEEDDDSSSDEE